MASLKTFLKLVLNKFKKEPTVKLTINEDGRLGDAPEFPFQYHSDFNKTYPAPLARLGDTAKYMSNAFARYCSQIGLQVTVAMDPQDYTQIFHVTNLNENIGVRIDFNKRDTLHLEPYEMGTVKLRSDYMMSQRIDEAFRVTMIPTGNR